MIVDCGVYREDRRRDGRVGLRDAEIASREDGAFVWIGLHEPTAEEFDSVRREFPLVIGVTLTVCGLMYRAFKRSGWL